MAPFWVVPYILGAVSKRMGSCRNYGPFFGWYPTYSVPYQKEWVVVEIMAPFLGGTLHIRCRIIIGTQKGTLILTARLMKGGGDPGLGCRVYLEDHGT